MAKGHDRGRDGRAGEGVRIGRMGASRNDPVALLREDDRFQESALVRALGEAAESVMAEARVLRVGEGMELLDGTSPPSDLLLVRHGRLSVVAAGDRVPVVDVGPGDVVGCAAALGRGAEGLAVVAAEPTELVAIPGRALSLAVALMPDLRALLERVLEERTRRVGEVDDFLDRW